MTRLLPRRHAIALAVAAVSALAACGGDADSENAADATTSPQTQAPAASNGTLTGGDPSSTTALVAPPPSPSPSTSAAPTTVTAVETTVPATGGVGVALIVDNTADPYIATMVRAAEAEAGMLAVSLTVTAVEADGDAATQIAAIDEAIARGDAGILITPSGDEVVPALERARSAGLYTFALDTAPNPPTAVDITFAADNFSAGQLLGRWTAAQLGDQTARIAMLDFVVDQPAPVDYLRDQGFLTGMGVTDRIETSGNGKEPESGTHAGGGDYEIVCHQPTMGVVDGGRAAMEACLAANPEINVVVHLQRGGRARRRRRHDRDPRRPRRRDHGVGGRWVRAGDAVGRRGCDQRHRAALPQPDGHARHGSHQDARRRRTPAGGHPGLDFVDTGVALVTDRPVAGLDSISLADAQAMCWGP